MTTTLTVAIIIMIATIIPSFEVIGNFHSPAYGQSSQTESNNMIRTGNLTGINRTNANVSEIVVSGAGNLVATTKGLLDDFHGRFNTGACIRDGH